MDDLHDLLQGHVDNGSIPGAVALVARGDRTNAAVAGSVAIVSAPMGRASIFRLASLTKPITAAAVMMLVDDGRITLDDPVDQWLPELANPNVVRTPASAIDDAACGPAVVLRAERRPRAAGLPAAGYLDGRARPGSPVVSARR